MRNFSDIDYYTGPDLTEEMKKAAEAKLMYRLPSSYLDLLAEQNGGVPMRRCFRTKVPTSWAPDHIQIAGLRGIGGEWGIDSDDGNGSSDMIAEWGYPNIGVVVCDMPSAGHDAVMLDYTECGCEGEPAVVYVDEDRSLVPLARSFAEFWDGLVDCDAANPR